MDNDFLSLRYAFNAILFVLDVTVEIANYVDYAFTSSL